MGLRSITCLHRENTVFPFRQPKLLGEPTNWTLQVTDASLSAGAGFVVVIAGNMMLMPGLPKQSRAESIDVDDSGREINV